MIKVLIVDDELAIRRLLRVGLESAEYKVIEAAAGREALSLAASHRPDLMVLDLGLPELSGFEVLERLREWSDLPVLVLTVQDDEDDKVRALDLGADDYVTKPFGTSELLARIRMALRHARAGTNTDAVRTGKFKSGGLVIDYDKYRVFVDGEDARLTQSEYRIVALLSRYAGRVLTYDFLLRELWGPYRNEKDDNKILRVNMANIRRKIEVSAAEPKYIFTEVGVGYRMAEPVES